MHDKEQNSFLIEQIKLIPSNLFKMKVAEHAENIRVLPPGTPRPGPLDLGYTPYFLRYRSTGLV